MTPIASRRPTALGDAPVTKLKTHRIAYADGMRLLAISTVVLFHVIYDAHVAVKAQYVEWIGIWGIDCFFVLTGFLLSGPFLRAVVDRTRLPTLRLYFVRRFLRIYPLYVVAVVFAAALVGVTLHESLSPTSLLLHAALLHGLSARYVIDLNWSLWTMSVDAQFYVVLPLVALLLHRGLRDFSRDDRRRAVWFVLGAIVVASIVERLAVMTLFAIHGREPSFTQVSAYARNVVGLAGNFAIGSMLAYRFVLAPDERIARTRASLLLTLAALSAFAMVVVAEIAVHARGGYVVEWTSIDLFGGASAGLLLYALLCGGFGALSTFVRLPAVAVAAALAYGVYLFHEPILWVIVERVPGMDRNAPAAGLLMLLATLAVAVPLHRYVEQPFLRRRDAARDDVAVAAAPAGG